MTEILLRNDKDWSVIDGEPCRVTAFTPSATVEDERVTAHSKHAPYATIDIECLGLAHDATGFITHKTDFLHLWSAFSERGAREDEEVIVFWTKSYLKRHARMLSKFMPRLWVMVCPKEAFELMTDADFKPELSGLARWEAQKARVEWKPDVLE